MTGDLHPIEQQIRDRGYETDEHEDRYGNVRAAAYTLDDPTLDDPRAVATAIAWSRTRAWRMVDAALHVREEQP